MAGYEMTGYESGRGQIQEQAKVIRAAKEKYAAQAAEAEKKPPVDDDVKPPPARNLVVCCDGTGNEFGTNNTNVVKLFGLLRKDPARQLAYYEPGVGTLSPPGMTTRLGQWVSRLWGLAFASGITANIEEAYKFLMDNYRPRDKVFLFGFSRGAYTVRALAGMIHVCGLLPKGNDNLIRYVTKMYRHGSGELQKDFKAFFSGSTECKPHFVGVWDTVKSVGFFVPVVDQPMNEDILYGRHALAIDERRGMYRPLPLTPPADSTGWRATAAPRIKQVWFPGVHSDVGGGYPNRDLSDVSLRWMISEAKGLGLELIDGWERCVEPKPASKPHNSLLPVWWALPFWRRTIPVTADIDPSHVASDADLKSYQARITRPVSPLEWGWGGVLSFAVLAVVGFLLAISCRWLADAVGWLGSKVGPIWNQFRDYLADTNLLVLGLWGALAMVVLGLVIWGVRYLKGGD